MYVCIESYVADVLRIDVHGLNGPCDAIAWQGRAFVGSGQWTACVEPYGRGVVLSDLDSAFNRFHGEDEVLLVVSSERIARLAPDGALLWQSEVVGDTGIERVRVTGESHRVVTGLGIWDSWETDVDDRHPFELDLETGALRGG